MDRKPKVTLLAIVALLLLIVPSLLWYKAHYSMTIARSFEIGSPSYAKHVLIATQGSLYKDALVAGIVDHLKTRSTYIRVMDVSALPSVQESDWNAIVVIHTWENWKPQPDARAFIERARDPKKILVVTTSGSGKERLAGVDAISAASVMEDVPTRLGLIESRLDALP